MERNRELFEKIAAQIEEQPDRWKQHHFVGDSECGTTMCIAGWAAHLTCGLILIDDTASRAYDLMPANGKGFMDHAMEVLGLNDEEAFDLFYTMWDESMTAGEVAEFLRAIGDGAEFDYNGLLDEPV